MTPNKEDLDQSAEYFRYLLMELGAALKTANRAWAAFPAQNDHHKAWGDTDRDIRKLIRNVEARRDNMHTAALTNGSLLE